MPDLWLVRHATPQVAPGLCYGALDVPAEPEATAEAAARLAAALPHGMRVRCSPRQRCRQLAAALSALRPELVIEADARLAEMDFGHWEGQAWDAIGQAALDVWLADFATHAPGDGESVTAFLRRVAAAYDDARLDTASRLWITHAGVIRAAQLLARGQRSITRADEWPREAVPFGQWTRLAI